ncbi:MAG: nuclear transport factor 2 family protein [Phycisphaerales bacterium]
MRTTRVYANPTVWATALLLLIGASLTLTRVQARQDVSMDKAYINRVLDAMHDAASKADGQAYFSYFDEGAVFLGTQSDERWAIPEFKEYVLPRFAEGKGWTYIPTTRHIYLNDEGTAGWFDEFLSNEKYGNCRGTGAVVKKNFEWKIVQYNLTVPIPNDLLPQFVESIRAHEKKVVEQQLEHRRKVIEELQKENNPNPPTKPQG